MKRNMKLTKKDADIVALKNFLPERKFNETVIKILRAAAKGKVAVMPMEFEIVPFEKHPGTKIELPEDLEHPPAVISVELLYNILVDFRTKMADREATYAGAENKYRKLCDSYYDGMVTLFNTVLADAYNSGDEKDCDRHLRQLDVDQIVNQAFEGNFGPQRVSDEGE